MNLLSLFLLFTPAFATDICSTYLESAEDAKSRIAEELRETPSTALVRYDPVAQYRETLKKIQSMKEVVSETELDQILRELHELSRLMEKIETRATWAQEILKSREGIAMWAQGVYLKLAENILAHQGVKTQRVDLPDGTQAIRVLGQNQSKMGRLAKHLSEKIGVTVQFGPKAIGPNVLGFFRSGDRSIYLNHNMLIVPRSGFRTFLHESRHAQYFGKRISAIDSVYHGYLTANNEGAVLSNSPIYNTYMSLEELMTHSLDTRVIGMWFDQIPADQIKEMYREIFLNLRGKVKNSLHITNQTLDLMLKFRSAGQVVERDVEIQFFKYVTTPKEMREVAWVEMAVATSVLRIPLVSEEQRQWAKHWVEINAKKLGPNQTQQELKPLLQKMNAEFSRRVNTHIELNQKLKAAYEAILAATDVAAKNRNYLPTPEELHQWSTLSQVPRRLTLEADRSFQPNGRYELDP